MNKERRQQIKGALWKLDNQLDDLTAELRQHTANLVRGFIEFEPDLIAELNAAQRTVEVASKLLASFRETHLTSLMVAQAEASPTIES